MNNIVRQGRVTYTYVKSQAELDYFTELILDSFTEIDQLAKCLGVNNDAFKKLYRKEVRTDIEISITRGVAICGKIDGEVAVFLCGCDVMDINMSELKKAYCEPFEPYERVMNSLYTLLKQSSKRGTDFYIQYIVKKPGIKDFLLPIRLIRLLTTLLSKKRGYKNIYTIPISSGALELQSNWNAQVISSINLSNLNFGGKRPFEKLNFDLKILKFHFEAHPDIFYTSYTIDGITHGTPRL